MPKRVGFQGEPGAFSEIAAHQMMEGCETVPFVSFPDLFQAVVRSRVDYAAVPIENTLAGSVHENYDLLLKSWLPILRETTVRISHCLIACPGATLSSIRRVYSHPVALLQCKRFLEKHQGNIEAVSAFDTAGSVKMIVEKQFKNSAAIAGKNCAQMYGGRILEAHLEDNPQNFTRFFLLGSKSENSVIAKNSKISVVLATRNEPGALGRCLEILASANINLTKIESRPIVGRSWEYRFYLDFMGNLATPGVGAVIKELQRATTFCRILGCYPADAINAES